MENDHFKTINFFACNPSRDPEHPKWDQIPVVHGQGQGIKVVGAPESSKISVMLYHCRKFYSEHNEIM